MSSYMSERIWMQKVIFYIRVSTAEQAIKVHSQRSQHDQLNKHCLVTPTVWKLFLTAILPKPLIDQHGLR